MPAIELALLSGIAFVFGEVGAVLWGLVFTEALRMVISSVLARRSLRMIDAKIGIVRAHFSLLKHVRADIIRMLIHTNFMAYFRMINTKVDIMILGAFRSSSEVAIYKLARALSTVIVRFTDPFFSAILPDLSRLCSEGRVEEYKALIKRCTATMTPIMIMAALGGVFFGQRIATLVSGPSYREAGTLLAIGIWGFAIGGIFFWTWPAAVSLARPDFGTKVGFLVIVVQLSLAFFLVPRFGSIGNIVSLVAAYVVGQPMMAFLVFRELNKSNAAKPILADAVPNVCE
jgi:O-antigen/teichoic acid export membrane protein